MQLGLSITVAVKETKSTFFKEISSENATAGNNMKLQKYFILLFSHLGPELDPEITKMNIV